MLKKKKNLVVVFEGLSCSRHFIGERNSIEGISYPFSFGLYLLNSFL